MSNSRTRASLAACATLAAVGLAAPAVHAQSLTLNSGDVVTVNSTGTKGTINNAAVSNNTTAYSSSITSGVVVRTNGTAAFILGPGGSLTNTATSGDGLDATGSGPVTVTGGSITIGTGGEALGAFGSVPVTVSGGTFTVGLGSIGLYAGGSGNFTVTGGTFATGSGGYTVFANTGSSMDLYGNFTGLMPGQTQALASGSGSFTGTLTNNTAAQTLSYYNQGGTITLHNTVAAAPEPSSVAALGLGVLGLCGLALKARKRTAA